MKTEIQKAKSRTDYQAKAQAFLDRFQIKFRATLSDTKVPPWASDTLWDDKPRHHYRITLSRNGFSESAWKETPIDELKARIKSRLTFDFWGSIADAEKGIKTVTTYDVLACISSDASMDTEFTGFGEWCDNYGFDRDSIKGLQTYRRCSAFAKRLQAFFTQEEIEALQEIQ